jgi:hypothetical protein
LKRKFLGVSVLAIMLSLAAAYGLLQVQVRIPATGNVKAVNIGVFSDQACSVALSSIDWGLMSPGESKSFTFYLKSLSNVNASLFLSNGNWEPSIAGGYISLSWNREGYRMAPGEIISAVLTLQVSSSIQGVSSFSFDAVVTAAEA